MTEMVNEPAQVEVDDGPLREDPNLLYLEAYRPKPPFKGGSYSKPKTSFAENGPKQLEDFICEALDRLGDGVKADMIMCSPVKFEIGTACSGTDVAVLVVKAYAKAFARKLGRRPEVDHIFSCESDPNKQRFLETMFTNTPDGSDMEALIGNTSALTFPRGGDREIFDELGQKFLPPLPTISDLMVGFPCQDVSKLNPAADEARWVVRDAGKRTGSVFNDVSKYCQNLLEDPRGKDVFRGCVLENVLGLQTPPKGKDPETGNPWHSNLDYCHRRMYQAGLLLMPFLLDPRMFGVPVSRQRIWMICVPLWMVSESGLSEEEVILEAQSMLDRLVDCSSHSCRSLEDFLYPVSHPCVQAEIQRGLDAKEKRESKKKGSKQKKPPKWATQHAQALERSGRDWWEPSHPDDAVMFKHPGLHALTDRQFDFCSVLKIKFPDERVACVELSQNLRGSKEREVKNNHCDIVTPNGQQLVTHQARLVCGQETLLLQGIHYGASQCRLEEMDSSLLRSLGGNAFQAHCCAAMFVVKQALQARLDSLALAKRKSAACSKKRARTWDDFCEWDS